MSIVPENVSDIIEVYYIFDSISLGIFNYRFSDIDYISVVKKRINNADITVLKGVHKNMKKIS